MPFILQTNGGPYPVSGLLYGGVRKTNDIKGRQTIGDETLHIDLIAGYAGNSHGTNF